MHPNVTRVADILKAASVTGTPVQLADSTRTAAEAAAALGCDVGAIASSLVFTADGDPLLIVTSGAHRVDTEHDVVWAAAGHSHAVFPTSYDELLRLTGGIPVQVQP